LRLPRGISTTISTTLGKASACCLLIPALYPAGTAAVPSGGAAAGQSL
jgi:hypothetical protein